jgi:hypothetical protein
MLIGGIVGWSGPKDDLFDANSSRNRDDCLAPFRVLREKANALDIQLHTIDVLIEKNIKPNFNLYIESVPIIEIENCKNYLIRFETDLTVPLNSDPNYLKQFDGIFSWDLEFLELADKNPLFEQIGSIPRYPFCYANALPDAYRAGLVENPGFSNRNIFCALIGSNRHANVVDDRELYSERVKVIRWFEANAPKEFALFGNGWRVPQKRLGTLGKFRYRLEKIPTIFFGRPAFPSYRGAIKSKYEVLTKSRFSICFENARDIRGYITEKIFDCFFAGCVPIYWGEPDIQEVIPSTCFIDFRDFLSFPDPYASLYEFIRDISEEKFLQYQYEARNFLSSPEFFPFTTDAFAESILRPIKL